jgi:hypothetical protein
MGARAQGWWSFFLVGQSTGKLVNFIHVNLEKKDRP